MSTDGADLPDQLPGRLIASGRDADVYDIGDGKVLRRYRDPEGRDTVDEAAVMRHVASKGFPVPAVHYADGADLVMDRIDGPTMLQTLARQPWKVHKMGRLLATLLDRLGEIEAPAFLLADGVERATGESVLHLDLHPINVLLSPTHGPTVIDWTNAAAGPPGFDAAMTYVVLQHRVGDVDQRPRRPQGADRVVPPGPHRRTVRAVRPCGVRPSSRRPEHRAVGTGRHRRATHVGSRRPQLTAPRPTAVRFS